jgi:hypothetical protein
VWLGMPMRFNNVEIIATITLRRCDEVGDVKLAMG